LPERDFEKLLVEAVDEALTSLGESSKQAIYFHLDENFSIKKDEIPCKIENFAKAIEKTFGFGAEFLEVLIMKHLCRKVGTAFECHESKDFTFIQYVTAAKRSFEQKSTETTEEIVECGEIELDV
jgi:hypothetical protein